MTIPLSRRDPPQPGGTCEGDESLRMKMMRLMTPYREYVEQFYRHRPHLEAASYEQQRQELSGDFFPGASDALAVELRSLGYETRDVHVTAAPAQETWARTHNVTVVGTRRTPEICRRQVLEFRPEVLFASPFSFPDGWLSDLRSSCPSIRLIVARHSSPRSDLSRFSECDVVFSGDPDQVRDLRDTGVPGFHVHHAFDSRVLRYLKISRREPHVFFSGQVALRPGFHLYRSDVLRTLYDSDVDLRLHLLVPSEGHPVRRLLQRFRHELSSRGKHSRERARDWRAILMASGSAVFGLDMFQKMSESLVTLNVHGDVSSRHANNIRLWEGTGVASCLLTDHKENMDQLFEVDREVVTFRSPDECREKALYLLQNRGAAKLIGLAGQKKVLREHTYSARAHEIDRILRESLVSRT